MEITKFNVQNREHSMPEVSYLKAGLMSPQDKENLESIKDMAGKAISEVNVSAEIGPELSEEIERLNSAVSDQSERLTRLRSITESQGYCGRVWDESNADPKAMTWCGNLDMLRNLPELLGLGCYLVQNDHTRRKLDPSNHYKFADDGTEARLDGSMGHYQWGWNKVFYITTWHENNLFYEVISFEPIKGRNSYRIPISSISACGFAIMDRDTDTLVSYINDSPRYRGGDNRPEYDEDPQRCLLGRPVTYKNTTAFATAAHKNGIGWFAGSMRMSMVLKVLFDIIMGTHSCQDNYNPEKDINGLYQGGLGDGIAYIFGTWNDWVNFNYARPFLHISSGIELGDVCGVTDELSFTYTDINDEYHTFTYKVPIFFGLKNPYGYLWRVSEDEFAEIINNECVHYALYDIFDTDHQHGIKSDSYKEIIKIPYINGIIKGLSYNNLECFPYDATGSTSTYHSDVFYSVYIQQNIRSVFRGGHARDKSDAGLCAIEIRYAYTYYMLCCGAALVEFTEKFPIEPVKQ